MNPIGAHVSIRGGVSNAPLRAREIGAGAFALFTKNQRRWQPGVLEDEEIRSFKRNCRSAGFSSERIVVHAGYLINLGSPEEPILFRSRAAFREELYRCRSLDLRYLVFHPGHHKGGMSEESSLDQITGFLLDCLKEFPSVIPVVENTAGMGSSVGYSFEHLARLIEADDRFGVCLDTCHLFAAGYDLRSRDAYDRTMGEFQRLVGFPRLRVVHLNDCLTDLGSRKDRHSGIGRGKLGLEAFRFIVNDTRIKGVPLILETPNSERWEEEIRLLQGMD